MYTADDELMITFNTMPENARDKGNVRYVFYE